MGFKPLILVGRLGKGEDETLALRIRGKAAEEGRCVETVFPVEETIQTLQTTHCKGSSGERQAGDTGSSCVVGPTRSGM